MLQILQGFSSCLFYWDPIGKCYGANRGLHLSQTSVCMVLDQFIYSATCLKLIEIRLSETSTVISPTLTAFSSSASAWLRVCLPPFSFYTLLYNLFSFIPTSYFEI